MLVSCLSFVARKTIWMIWSVGKSLLASLSLPEWLWLDPLEHGNLLQLIEVNHTCKAGWHLPAGAGQPPQTALTLLGHQPGHQKRLRTLWKYRDICSGLSDNRKDALACPWLMNMLIMVSSSCFQGGVMFLSPLHTPHYLSSVHMDCPMAREVNSELLRFIQLPQK